MTAGRFNPLTYKEEVITHARLADKVHSDLIQAGVKATLEVKTTHSVLTAGEKWIDVHAVVGDPDVLLIHSEGVDIVDAVYVNEFAKTFLR